MSSTCPPEILITCNCIYKIAKRPIASTEPTIDPPQGGFTQLHERDQKKHNTVSSEQLMIQFLNSLPPPPPREKKKQKRANEGHKIDRKDIPPMIDPNTIRNAMRAYYDGIVKPPGHLNTNRSIASKAALETTPRLSLVSRLS